MSGASPSVVVLKPIGSTAPRLTFGSSARVSPKRNRARPLCSNDVPMSVPKTPYHHDEQQDGSEFTGDRRQRDTAEPNSTCFRHRADPVRSWREGTSSLACTDVQAPKCA